MGRSQLLRHADVRSLLRLMGEIGELPRDRRVRTAHMMEGLCRITRARAGTVTVANHTYDRRGRRRINVIEGQLVGVDDRGQAVVQEYLKRLEPADPLSHPLYSTEGALVVRAREQLLGADAWHRSAHFNEVRRGMGVDDCVAAKIVVAETPSKVVQTVCIHRAVHDGTFGPRHWQMMELFLAEAQPFIDPQESLTLRPQPIDGRPLSPRLAEVLGALLQGDSAKQIARRLGLSIHTVRDYVKTLYARFGVSGHGELLALFVRR